MPLQRSNRELCQGQMTTSPSRFPSAGGPPKWLHVFVIAHSSPLTERGRRTASPSTSRRCIAEPGRRRRRRSRHRYRKSAVRLAPDRRRASRLRDGRSWRPHCAPSVAAGRSRRRATSGLPRSTRRIPGSLLSPLGTLSDEFLPDRRSMRCFTLTVGLPGIVDPSDALTSCERNDTSGPRAGMNVGRAMRTGSRTPEVPSSSHAVDVTS